MGIGTGYGYEEVKYPLESTFALAGCESTGLNADEEALFIDIPGCLKYCVLTNPV
jgi:hypothetical protein